MMHDLASLLGLNRPARARALKVLIVAAFITCFLIFPAAKATVGCVFLFGLICAAAIDLDHLIIPDLFSVGLAAVGVAASFLVPSLHDGSHSLMLASMRSGAASLLGVAVGSAFGLWIALLGELLLGREVLGFGDVKFLGAIGAFCGWQGAVFSVFGGAAFGLIALVFAEAYNRLSPRATPLIRLESPTGGCVKLGWGAQFPFGPMLAVASAAYFVGLHFWVDSYLSLYKGLF